MESVSASSRDIIFGGSSDKGTEEFNTSDIDWLFSLGLPRIRYALLWGNSVRAGSLYLSDYCEKLFVAIEDNARLLRLRAIVREEGLTNVFFISMNDTAIKTIQGMVDYLVIFEDMSDKRKRDSIFSLVSPLLSDNGILGVSFKARRGESIKKELSGQGLNHSETFWVFPNVLRPTWSGKVNDKRSYTILLDVIDFHSISSVPLWMKQVIFSRPVKALLKLLCNLLYPLRVAFINSYYLFASSNKECPERILPNIEKASFVRKSKASKEGRVLFFIREPVTHKIKVNYFSKLPRYNTLLLNELQRNAFNPWPISQRSLNNGGVFLESDFVEGKRLSSQPRGADKEVVYWLLEFQKRTFTGYWKEDEWKAYLSKMTFGMADGLAGSFLELMRAENKHPFIVAEHGDFDYLNIMKTRKGPCVFDWEYFQLSGDEFLDISYFILNLYAEEISGRSVSLRDFISRGSVKDCLDSFMKDKGLKNTNIFIFSIAIAAMRIKHQSLYYASVKDSRYWAFDKILGQLHREVMV